ncbi:hypothetical protein HOI26_02455 [Candidatus Woesearchaeota archaeon]|jgi:hypothetical protein|nr:hypothetical protein [Candidatus Woesearchaeota archaeon]MBT5739940.1 hypothetical protein [Candidatus Woesearchaeota archaeon]
MAKTLEESFEEIWPNLGNRSTKEDPTPHMVKLRLADFVDQYHSKLSKNLNNFPNGEEVREEFNSSQLMDLYGSISDYIFGKRDISHF